MKERGFTLCIFVRMFFDFSDFGCGFYFGFYAGGLSGAVSGEASERVKGREKKTDVLI